jgi:hypothetical protein
LREEVQDNKPNLLIKKCPVLWGQLQRNGRWFYDPKENIINNMRHNDASNKGFPDKPNKLSEDEIDDKEDWLNEHGQPDFKYLQSLENDGSQEALEKLRSIAEDLDVEYDPNTSTEELIGRIRSVVRQNEDGGSDPTT